MSEFGADHALIHETVVTGRKVGAGKDFWATLAHSEELFAEVVAFVTEQTRVIFTLTSKIDRDMEGWTCPKPVKAEEDEFEPILCEFLQSGETRISGEEMIGRAREQKIQTGLRHAEAMLRNQERIPVDWRKYYLVFPESWWYPADRRNVFCLYWVGGCWYLYYRWLGSAFGFDYRFVSSRK